MKTSSLLMMSLSSSMLLLMATALSRDDGGACYSIPDDDSDDGVDLIWLIESDACQKAHSIATNNRKHRRFEEKYIEAGGSTAYMEQLLGKIASLSNVSMVVDDDAPAPVVNIDSIFDDLHRQNSQPENDTESIQSESEPPQQIPGRMIKRIQSSSNVVAPVASASSNPDRSGGSSPLEDILQRARRYSSHRSLSRSPPGSAQVERVSSDLTDNRRSPVSEQRNDADDDDDMFRPFSKPSDMRKVRAARFARDSHYSLSS